jgi:translation initiation factor IF-1
MAGACSGVLSRSGGTTIQRLPRESRTPSKRCRRAICILPRDVAQSLIWKGQNLSKDDLIDVQGTVVAVHSGGLYRVQCDQGHEVLAQLSGRMRRFRIKVVPGDRVTVGVSPYDPVRGIITFRAR